jgi:cold shock protein
MLNTASEQTGAVASTGAPTELKAARRADSGNSGSVPRHEPEPRESRMNRIAQRAHQIYEARGGEHGKAMEDWLQAEREIDAELDNARAERAEWAAAPNMWLSEASGTAALREGETLHRKGVWYSARGRDWYMASTTGTIKRKTDKGFGFIAAADGTEYFFHQSGCVGIRFDDLREGQRVSFTVGQGPKGPRAENVKAE